MGFRLAGTARVRGGVALAVALTAVGGAVVYTEAAGAAPQPTIGQVQTQVNSLQAKVDRIGQEYDQASEQLTAAQQAQVAAASVGATGTTGTTGTTGATGTSGTSGTTTSTYTGPTNTQAGEAVAFAYAQLGKPYQWGATGPGAYDCSGLVQAAWAAAGVSIPRVTYDQWAALPHISASSLQPGDLVYYEGEGHVAMYVGGGYIIDAPRTGLTVEKVPMTGWYANIDGVVRP